jgi:hypothetical protein
MATATLSHEFIINVRLLYKNSLTQLVSGKVIRQGINCHTNHAAPALVSAVAAVEVFINELAFGSLAMAVLPNSPLWTLQKTWLQELEVRAKLVIIPFLLFGRTFERDRQPFQDFTLLVKARNEVVHYKMDNKVPVYLKSLQDRNIALMSPEGYPQLVWIHALCCSEMIRWANNTATLTAQSLVDFMPEENKPFLFSQLAQNFIEIPDSVPTDCLTSAGIDPGSNDPEPHPGTGIRLP